MPKNKILLISIVRDTHRNLSCLALFAYLVENGVDANLLFLPREEEYNESLFRDFISSRDFSVIGISLMTPGFHFTKQLTADIRKHSPGSHVVWGGIHPTLMPEECLEYADSLCLGEGEEALLALAGRIERNEDPAGIPGIAVKSSGGKIFSTPPELIEDINSLPLIRYDWERFFVQDKAGLRPFNRDEYAKLSNYNGEDYTLMATRSCPFSCSYCCNSFLNALYGNGGKVRRRKIENVIREIRQAMDTIGGIRFINFIDDQFLTSRKWLEEFLTEYEKEIGLPFIVRLAPGTFGENDAKRLSAAGLNFVQIGIQSGSERTHRDIFNRRFKREDIVNSSKILSRAGIHPIYDVIIQNDFEDDSDRDETIRLMLELEKPFSLTLFALTPFPKTRLEEIYREKGIVPRTDPYGKGYGDYIEDDFYYQLAGLIPHISNSLARFFFKNSKSRAARSVLKAYHQLFKKHRKKRVTAQRN